MQYAALGHSGLKVSSLGLGTMNFGAAAAGADHEAEARRVIDAFLDAGGNLIDTADVYHGGRSEEIVGRAIAGKRDRVVLATKGSGPQGEGPNDRGLSRAHLTRALESSLARLGTDYIDLYQCHNWYSDTPVEETMATLDGFVRAGKVRYLGCSNYTAAQIVEAQSAAHHARGTPFISLQSHYSLLAREIEAEILPVCARHGIGAISYGPLAGGMLAGRYRRGEEPEPGTRMSNWLSFPHPAARQWASAMLTDRGFDIADTVTAAAKQLDTSAATVAIAWTLRHGGITSVLVGPRTAEQLEDHLAVARLELPPAITAELDAISEPMNRPVSGLPIAPPGG